MAIERRVGLGIGHRFSWDISWVGEKVLTSRGEHVSSDVLDGNVEGFVTLTKDIIFSPLGAFLLVQPRDCIVLDLLDCPRHERNDCPLRSLSPVDRRYRKSICYRVWKNICTDGSQQDPILPKAAT